MPVFTKTWNEPVAILDGTRILITRFRPRGLSKADETWEVWMPHLGPSAKLLAAFKGKGREAIGWSTYRVAYLKEMREQHAVIVDLARRVAAGESITLLCSSTCLREARCHRSLLRDLIETASAADSKEKTSAQSHVGPPCKFGAR